MFAFIGKTCLVSRVICKRTKYKTGNEKTAQEKSKKKIKE